MKLAVQFGLFNSLVNSAAGLYGFVAGQPALGHVLQLAVFAAGLWLLFYPSLQRLRLFFAADIAVPLVVGVLSYDPPASMLAKRVTGVLAEQAASAALEITVFWVFVVLAFAMRLVPLYYLYTLK